MPDETPMAAPVEPASSAPAEPQTPPAADGSSPPAAAPETPTPTAEPPASEPVSAEDSEKRIRDLQSKWDSERALRMKTEQELERAKAPQTPAEEPEPTSVAELLERAERRAFDRLNTETQRKADAASKVDALFSEIAAADSEFDKSAFATWASGKPFRMETLDDLRGLYSVYRDIRTAERKGEQRALKNKDARAADPVAKPAIGAPATPPMLSAEQFQRAGSAYEAMQMAMERTVGRT